MHMTNNADVYTANPCSVPTKCNDIVLSLCQQWSEPARSILEIFLSLLSNPLILKQWKSSLETSFLHLLVPKVRSARVGRHQRSRNTLYWIKNQCWRRSAQKLSVHNRRVWNSDKTLKVHHFPWIWRHGSCRPSWDQVQRSWFPPGFYP